MHVLVTGATGFLGAHVVHALVDAGHRVRALLHSDRPAAHLEREGVAFARGDLLDERSLKAACRGVEGVVHAAGRLGYWSRDRAAQRRVNVEGTAALLRAARKQGVARVVHVSSVAAVGATCDGALLDERAAWAPEFARVHYALSTRQGEERALAAAARGLPVVVVNPAALLGPRLDRPGPSGLVAAHLSGRLRWTPPGGLSVTDVRDAADAIVAALRRGRPGERYVLAGHNLGYAELYAALHARFGGRAPRRVTSRRTLALLRGATEVLDALRLTRPGWTPELLRGLAYRGWYTSAKAEAELGYRVRPLAEILRRSAGDAGPPRAPADDATPCAAPRPARRPRARGA
ncbi:MAG: NAD-dependent epimerase/dehydratase family protein [Planctomycetes bacterium]|nr:NAD-dependent epimerase/dehydratase family protein [Planctomycetota bacterium]